MVFEKLKVKKKKNRLNQNKILLIGSKGQVGKTLIDEGIKNFKIVFLNSKKKENKNNFKKIAQTINSIKPQIIINAAAFTNVDMSEIKKKISKKTNFEAVKNLSKLCKKHNILLVHFSSDYVFGNSSNKTLVEDSEKTPINYYGYTKLKSEEAIKKSKCNFVILRTAWVYSIYKKNFFYSIRKKLNSEINLNIVNDQIGTPTSTLFLQEIIEKILNKVLKNNFKIKQIFNTVPNGYVSWFQFAKFIKKSFNIKKTKLSEIETAEFKSVAKRQLNSRLSNKKLQNYLNFKIKSWMFYYNKTKKLLENNSLH